MSKLDDLRAMREARARGLGSGGERREPPAVEVRERVGKNEGLCQPLAGVATGLPEVKRRRGRARIGQRTKTLSYTKPWELEGMSRSTWFRRQREVRDG